MPLLIKEARTVTQTQPNQKRVAETLTLNNVKRKDGLFLDLPGHFVKFISNMGVHLISRIFGQNRRRISRQKMSRISVNLHFKALMGSLKEMTTRTAISTPQTNDLIG